MNWIFKILVVAILFPVFSAPVPAVAAGKVHHIGFLAPWHIAIDTPRVEAFRQGLRELGYVEGRNITIEWRSSEGRNDRLPSLAAELVRKKVEVIVACCQPAVDAARKATSTIPIVVAVTADYVGQGLAKSLRRPGGNVTGLSAIGPELMGKQLELFKETVPKLSLVAVLWNTAHRGHPAMVRQAKAAAEVLDMRFVDIGVRGPDEFAGAFRRMAAEGVEGVVVFRGGMFRTNKTRMVELARKAALPIMFGHIDEAEAGGLMAYGTDTLVLFRRAAGFVDKILKGANPAEIPIEQPTTFYLAVNLKTAKALGIKVPRSILLRATKVIE
jgi:putative ABC transport system substrate-binding protein